MQHRKFTLADKMQYVSVLLGYQNIVVDDLEQRLLVEMVTMNVSGEDDYALVRQWLRPCRDEFIKIHAAMYDVLNATDSKRASAVVKGLRTSYRGSKLN